MIRFLRAALLCAPFLSGCAFSYRTFHRSPLLVLEASSGLDDERRVELRRLSPRFEDAIVLMARDFGVPLEKVIPVRVYHSGGEGTSYYNRLTRAIVLYGEPGREVFAHELSHLLAHRAHGSPPYWSDQALADSMEGRYGGPGAGEFERLQRRLRGPFIAGSAAEGNAGGLPARSAHLLQRIAQESDASEVLTHISRRAVDEERSWGVVLVRYLFEERWREEEMPEKIGRLFALSEAEVAALAPEFLEYCRRWELVGDGAAATR